MRNVNASVTGALHTTEDTSSSGCAGKTNVKEALERPAALSIFTFGSFGQLVFSVGFLDAGEIFIKAKLLQSTTSDQETGGVGSGPVGETMGDTVGLELVSVCGTEDLVASDFGGDNLADDVAVGEADNEAVFGSVVL